MGFQLPTSLPQLVSLYTGFLVAINWCAPQDHPPPNDLDARSTVHDVRTRQVRLVARGGWKLAQDVLIMIEVNPLKPEDGKTLKRSHQNESSQDFSSTYFQSKKKNKKVRLKSGRKLGW